MSSTPKAIQFGPCLSQLLQRIWEADPKEGPVWLPKWDISYDFHWCNIRPIDVVKFDYVVTPITSDTSRLICVDLVLPMGWVKSPDLFWCASETFAYNANE